MSDLDQRLLAMYSHRGDGLPTQYVNPDGPGAFAEIEALRGRVTILTAAVERAIRQAQNIGIESGNYYETLLAAIGEDIGGGRG